MISKIQLACVMKRMKADKSLGYNYDTDRFELDSRKEDHIFLNLEALCENKIKTADRSEGAINRNDRIKAMKNMVHSLNSDRLLELRRQICDLEKMCLWSTENSCRNS